MLAVVSGSEACATEMARRFEAAGELIETVWFPHADALRAQVRDRKSRFEVVILFSEAKVWQAAEADAEALRKWLAGTPVIEAVA